MRIIENLKKTSDTKKTIENLRYNDRALYKKQNTMTDNRNSVTEYIDTVRSGKYVNTNDVQRYAQASGKYRKDITDAYNMGLYDPRDYESEIAWLDSVDRSLETSEKYAMLGFDKLDTDVVGVVNNIGNGWRTQEEINGGIGIIDAKWNAAQGVIDNFYANYSEYAKVLSEEELADVEAYFADISTMYSDIIGSLENESAYYGQYSSKDEYDTDKKYRDQYSQRSTGINLKRYAEFLNNTDPTPEEREEAEWLDNYIRQNVSYDDYMNYYDYFAGSVGDVYATNFGEELKSNSLRNTVYSPDMSYEKADERLWEISGDYENNKEEYWLLRDAVSQNPEHAKTESEAITEYAKNVTSEWSDWDEWGEEELSTAISDFERIVMRYAPEYYFEHFEGNMSLDKFKNSPYTFIYEVQKFFDKGLAKSAVLAEVSSFKNSDLYDNFLLRTKNGEASPNVKKAEFMTAEEKACYLYLEQYSGQEAADIYYDSIEEGLNYKKGKRTANRIDNIDSDFLRKTKSQALALGAGVESWYSGIIQAFSEEERKNSSLQYANMEIQEDIARRGSKREKFAYDAMYTLGNMAPSVALSFIPGVGSVLGSASMGASAMGNSYKQARMQGYNHSQAMNYGALVGIAEGSLSYLLGGVGKIGGKATQNLTKSLSNIDNAFLRIAANTGKEMLSEATEEYLQETLDPIFRNLLLGEDNEIQLVSEEQAYSALMGAVMSLGFGVSGIVNEVSANNVYMKAASDFGYADVSSYNPNTVEGYDNLMAEVSRIEELAMNGEIDLNTEAVERAFKINQKLTENKKISDSEIRNFLMSTTSSVDTISSKAAKHKYTEYLKDKEGVVDGYKIDKNGTMYRDDSSIDKKIREIMNAESAGTNADHLEITKDIEKSGSELPKLHVDDVLDIVSSDGTGNMTVSTKGGELTVKPVQLEGGEKAALYRAAAGLDTEGAKELVSSYEISKSLNPELSLDDYISSFSAIYNAARMGLNIQDNYDDLDRSVSMLGDTLSQVAYNVGMYDAQTRIETEEHVPTVETEKAGTVTDTGNALSEAERGVVQAVAEKLQIPIVVTNEYSVNGKTYRLGENNPAKYIVSTATMLLSPDAENLTGSLLHELGEFVTATSPAKSKQICTALIRFYAEEFGSKKASQWIKTYQNAYAAAEGGKTYDAATRELMHDALAAVFSKKRNTQKFIDWLGNTQTKKNANKIKSWFAELLKKMKSVIHSLFTEGELNPMQKDVALLQEEKLESLADMFLDALDESKAKVQKTTKKEAVKTSEVKNHVQVENEISSFAQQLQDWQSGLGKKNGSYNGAYFELGKTPSSLIKNNGESLDLIMYEDCLLKIIGGKHSISLQELSYLPEELEDPVLLFKGTAWNSYVALTEMIDKNGHEVIVAVHIDRYHNRHRINKIASLYSKTDKYGNNRIKDYVYAQLTDGNLIDASIEKAPMWFTSRGLQLPKLVQTIIDAKNSLSHYDQNVNTTEIISDEEVHNQIKINGQDLAHIDDNEELKAIVVDMIEQKRRTSKSRRNILSKDVRPFAKQILSDNSSSYNLTTFTSELTKLYELMARGEREDVIRHYANYIGEKVLEASENNGEISDRNRSLLNDIKGVPMKLTKAQREVLSEKYGMTFEEFAAKNSKYMTFSANGRYIHDIWSELSTKNPDVFDAGMPKAEMAMELAGIAVQLSNTYNGEFSLSDDAQYLGAELVAGFDTVGTTKRTGADIEAERISEIKKAKNKRIAEIRDFKNEQIKRVKTQYSNAVSDNRAIKSDYRAEVREELLYRYEKEARIEQITKSLRRLERMLVSERDSDHVPENLKTTMADFCTRFINKGVFKEKNISLLRRQLKSIADSSESQANVEFDEEALGILEYLEEEMANGDSRYVQELGFRVLDIAEEISLAKRRDVSKLKETLETFKTRYVQDDIIIADKGNLEEDVAYLVSVAIDHTENTATIKTLHNLSNELKNTDEHSLSAFGLETLDAIKDVVDMFNGIVSNANELFIEGKRQALQEVGDELISELELKGRKKFKFHPAISRFVDNIVKANTTTNYFFKTVGGVFEKLYNEFLKAQNVHGLRVDQAREFMLDVKKRYNYLDWRNNKYFITGNDGKVEFQVTAGELLMIYATDKRQQREYLKGIKHLQDGGIVLEYKFIKAVKEVEEEYKKAEKKNERVDENEKNKKIERLAMGSAVKLSDSDISSAINKLTDDQKRFADEIVEFMSTVCAGWGNETSMKLHNIRKYLETYYFPYVTPDTHKLFRIGSNEQVNRLLGASFTHRTVRKANTPIVLSDFCEIASSHISSMAAYSTHAIPAKNMHDLLNYKDVLDHNVTVMAKLQDAYGTDAIGKYIQEYLNDVQSGAVQESRENLLLKGIGRVGKLQVMAKTSVGLRQFSSLYRAGAELNPKYIAAAHKLLLPGKKKRKKTYQKMKKYSGIVTIKEIGGFDASSGRSAAKWINSNEYGVNHPIQAVLDKGKWDDALGALASASDRLAWCIIWEATEMEIRKQIKKGTLDAKKGSQEYYDAVNKRFTQVINDTQVYNSVHAKTPAMRAKTYGMKALTQYMGEPMAILNMANYAIYNALTDKSAKNTVKALRVIFCGIVLGIVADAAINGFGRAFKDDDEDETFVEKWAQSSIDSLWDNLNPISYIPGFKDVYNFFKGYSSEKPEMSLVSDIYWAFKNVDWDKLMDSSDEKWDLTEAVTYAAALIMGEPIHNVASDIRALWTTISNETAFYKGTNWGALEGYALDSLNESFPIISKFTNWDRSDTGQLDNMYEALLEGDLGEFKNIKTQYLNSYEDKTEDDIISAIGERLRSNAVLQNIALSYVNSEWDLYEDSYNELLDLGFSEEMIDKAFDHILSKAKTIAKTNVTLNKDLSEEEKKSVQEERDGAMENLREYGLSDEEIEVLASNTNEGLVDSAYMASINENEHEVLEIVNIIIERKKKDKLDKSPNFLEIYDEEDLEREARNSTRKVFTDKYRKPYLDAYEEGNGAEAKRILAFLEMTGLYDDIEDTAEGWIENYEEEKILKG